ncbi:DUF481 domain-containing protein [Aliidiomarina sp. Khilg15.8]
MRFHFVALMTLVCTLASVPAMAIVNIEEMRLDESQPGWKLSSTLSLDGKRGNVREDQFALSVATQFITQDLKVRNLLLASMASDRTEGVTYSEDYFTHLRHTRQLRPNLAWELFAQYQHEPVNNDYRRQLVGSNARFNVDKGIIDGHAGIGLMFEETAVDGPSLTPVPESETVIERRDWRLNLYLDSTHALNENSDFAIGFYVQPALDDIKNVRSVVNAGITSRISRLFALTLDVSYSNESKPLLGQAHSEWAYNMGFNIRF